MHSGPKRKALTAWDAGNARRVRRREFAEKLLTARVAKNSREDREEYNCEEEDRDMLGFFANFAEFLSRTLRNFFRELCGFSFVNSADFFRDLRGFSSRTLRIFFANFAVKGFFLCLEPELTLLRSCGQLTDSRNEGAGGARQGAVATVGNGEFAPEFLFLGRNQFHAARQHLVAGEAGADQ